MINLPTVGHTGADLGVRSGRLKRSALGGQEEGHGREESRNVRRNALHPETGPSSVSESRHSLHRALSGFHSSSAAHCCVTLGR
jgi:hypothetical protein